MSEIEIISKEIEARDREANIIHKKVIILLSALAGLGTILHKTTNSIIWQVMIISAFIILSIGVFVNYQRLNKLRLKVENLTKELERSKNE